MLKWLKAAWLSWLKSRKFLHDFPIDPPKGGGFFLRHVTMLTTSFIRAPQPAWRMGIIPYDEANGQWAMVKPMIF